MSRRLVRFLTTLLLCLFAGAARAEPPVWVVHGTHCTIVLFGSVHILPPDLAWEPPKLKRAVARAHEIWFEIPLDDASMAAASLAAESEGLQPPGQTLSAELNPADRARLGVLSQTYAVPMEELDRLKPWLAEIRLSVASYRDLGASRDLGVEHQILEGASGPLKHPRNRSAIWPRGPRPTRSPRSKRRSASLKPGRPPFSA